MGLEVEQLLGRRPAVAPLLELVQGLLQVLFGECALPELVQPAGQLRGIDHGVLPLLKSRSGFYFKRLVPTRRPEPGVPGSCQVAGLIAARGFLLAANRSGDCRLGL